MSLPLRIMEAAAARSTTTSLRDWIDGTRKDAGCGTLVVYPAGITALSREGASAPTGSAVAGWAGRISGVAG
jgi:hypothetical protein